MSSSRAPMRRCAVCGSAGARTSFVRVVRTFGGHLVDGTDLPVSGRSAHLCPKNSCVGQARRRGVLERRLGAEAPAALWDLLLQRVRESSQVVC